MFLKGSTKLLRIKAEYLKKGCKVSAIESSLETSMMKNLRNLPEKLKALYNLCDNGYNNFRNNALITQL